MWTDSSESSKFVHFIENYFELIEWTREQMKEEKFS